MAEEEIVAPLTDLYRAGKETFPRFAEMVAKATEELGGFYDVWKGQLAEAGNPPSLVDAVAINGECYDLLRRAVIFINNGAEALVHAADELARSDSDAAESSITLKRLVQEPLRTPAVPAPREEDAA